MPFVVDGIGYSQVGKELGGGWTPNFPDPFTPPAGPNFRSRGVTVQVVDGRQQRNPDSSLTSQPLRSCNVWMGPQDETALISAVRRIAESDTRAKIVPYIGSERTLQVVACIPTPTGAAVMRMSSYGDGTTGVGVYETVRERIPAECEL